MKEAVRRNVASVRRATVAPEVEEEDFDAEPLPTEPTRKKKRPYGAENLAAAQRAKSALCREERQHPLYARTVQKMTPGVHQRTPTTGDIKRVREGGSLPVAAFRRKEIDKATRMLRRDLRAEFNGIASVRAHLLIGEVCRRYAEGRVCEATLEASGGSIMRMDGADATEKVAYRMLLRADGAMRSALRDLEQERQRCQGPKVQGKSVRPKDSLVSRLRRHATAGDTADGGRE